VRLSVGKDAADASTRRLRKEAELNAVNHGVAVSPDDEQNGHRSITAAITDFLDETKLMKKPKTWAAYSTALGYFQESCPKLYLEEIERGDLLKFSAFLRDQKEQSPRSVYNKFENLMTFLKSNGIRGLVGKNDWPRYVEETTVRARSRTARCAETLGTALPRRPSNYTKGLARKSQVEFQFR